MSNNEYKATRLLFRAEVIESLADNDFFSVHTPEGTFSMTKVDFYRVFSNVVKTKSYRDKGIYHYPTTPKKALQFLNVAE
jgi:hypothetical protein